MRSSSLYIEYIKQTKEGGSSLKYLNSKQQLLVIFFGRLCLCALIFTNGFTDLDTVFTVF